MMKRIVSAAVLTGAALAMTATAASAAPMPQPPVANAGQAIAPPDGMDAHPPTSISPDGTNELNKLNQLNQLGKVGQATQALDPVLGLLAPLAGVLPM
ncbi:hypothetical protein IPZ58_36690 [Streptomyces roseoverticillatus]|nr:hypothetical protein [Streptomyces roseoverticillatus]MCF3107052.1 hypothetical protein [Streptomyces roseoverticillatus]